MTKSVPGFRAFVVKMQYDEAHIRSSRRSVSDFAKFHGSEVDQHTLAEYDSDWAASTEGLILMCLLFATSGKHGCGLDGADRAVAFLQAFLSTFMTEAAAYLELTDEHDDCIGRVVFDQWQVSVAPGARMGASLAAILKHKQPLVDVLVELSQTIRRPSQSSEARVRYSVLLLHNFVDYIAATTDLKRNEGTFDRHDHLSMPDLFGAGSSRPRRVPNTMKQTVSREVLAQPSLRNAGQFLAARRILFGGVRKRKQTQAKSPLVHPASGRAFCEDNIKSYMQAAKQQVGRCRHGYVGMDGTTVSNKAMVFYVFEALGVRKACWLVPKAIP